MKAGIRSVASDMADDLSAPSACPHAGGLSLFSDQSGFLECWWGKNGDKSLDLRFNPLASNRRHCAST